jgi:hypothetical protein
MSLVVEPLLFAKGTRRNEERPRGRDIEGIVEYRAGTYQPNWRRNDEVVEVSARF